MADVSDSQIAEVYADVRKDNTDTNWYFLFRFDKFIRKKNKKTKNFISQFFFLKKKIGFFLVMKAQQATKLLLLDLVLEV